MARGEEARGEDVDRAPRGSGGPHGGRGWQGRAGHPFGPHAEALRELVIEKLSERGLGRDRADAPRRVDADAPDVGSDGVDRLQFWTRVRPPGRRPRLSRDELANAAVRILDSEGLDALSMRRLAGELGVGTMTLYHYVETKREVLALALDTVMGEVLVGSEEQLPDDWRAAVTLVATRSRDAARRHPWMMEAHGITPYGPSTIRHFDESLAAVRNLDAPLEAKLDVLTAVDEFVYGFCVAESAKFVRERTPDVTAYLTVLLETGAYPELSALADEHGLEEIWDRLSAHGADEGRFDRNLARLLDGLEHALDSGSSGR